MIEPNRCFHCGRGHIKLKEDKIKVNGVPENICEECYGIYRNMD